MIISINPVAEKKSPPLARLINHSPNEHNLIGKQLKLFVKLFIRLILFFIGNLNTVPYGGFQCISVYIF